ncbi:MAG TPA: hypothetical protein VFE32_14825 [Puia sp.]|jgi:hypothetical protein|nr:hypothetical protein [Puia sp.]
MTAHEILSKYHGTVVAITNSNDETLVGIVMMAAGLEKAGTLMPKTSFLEVDLIEDMEQYKKLFMNYKFKHHIIHEDDIEDIRPYDLSGKPIYIDYSVFQDLTSGQSPTYVWEMIREIKAGKLFIVTQVGAQYKLKLGEDDVFQLE